ncbi:hypothetical protein [Variovorax soli]|uniref:Type III secretory pathway component EscS n=1 Tax=Variovorax soli TaxID=376815 RepID=A0ABU1NEU3_9BURK|nr:hypothetical protein [Variovorax soli]MDR6536982.1 type III secretory pathway component EscS [Variovorax soli]
MNWNLGLRRLSAVVWSVVGFFGLLLVQLVWHVQEEAVSFLVGVVVVVSIAVAMHRVTSWVINGFTSYH